MRTLSLSEAAALLRMHPEEVRRRAKCGAIPGAKPGRCWIFIEDDLAEYVRSFSSRRDETHVFSFRGRPIRQVSTKAWYRALERAGIQDFRWHDLRHTWASWHVQNGTPIFALKELGGWESPEMVRHYAHLSAEHLAPYADRLCALHAVEGPADGTFTAQAVNENGLA